MYKFFVSICKVFVSITVSIGSLFSFLPSNKQIGEIKKNALVLAGDFTVTAHAGAMLTPSNSLWSLRQIVMTDADIVEFDVTFRPDGTPVIKHTEKPSQHQGVLLSKALEIIAGHESMEINLDMKATWNLPAVQELVEEYDMLERVFFTGIGKDKLTQVQQEGMKIPYYLNVGISGDIEDEEMLRTLAEELIDYGAIGINLNYKGASRKLCEIMHEHELLVSVWTVNGTLDMHKMLSIGADNITTRKPNKLLKLIENWQEE